MQSFIFVTLSGQDHSGLIKGLAIVTHESGGRWLNSKLASLHGYFSGVIKIEIDTSCCATLSDKIKQYIAGYNDVQCLLFTLDAHQDALTHDRHKITIDTEDQYGLIKQISETLLDFDCDIIQLDCHRYAASDIDTLMFSCELVISTPSNVAITDIIQTLQKIDHKAVINSVN